MSRISPVCLAAALLASCAAETALIGERFDALPATQNPGGRGAQTISLPVRLPPGQENPAWTQNAHGLQHPALAGAVKQRWSVTAGRTGASNLIAQPVSGENRVFVLDGRAAIRGFDAKTGQQLWRQTLRVKGEAISAAFGGGLALDGGKLFAATGLGSLAALDPKSGKILWRVEGGLPFRAAPAADSGRIFAIAYNNRLTARDANNGDEIWVHQTIAETASLMLTHAPAVARRLIITPYNSGEVFALRAENGAFIWSDTLASDQSVNPGVVGVASIATPIVDANNVITFGSGRMIAVDLKNGQRKWTRDLSGSQPPWIAGEFLFLLNAQSEAICLDLNSGKTIWTSPLPRKREGGDNVIWNGPVLAGGRLLFTSSDGVLASLNPQTGASVSAQKLADGFLTAPIVAARTLYLLSSSMELIALN